MAKLGTEDGAPDFGPKEFNDSAKHTGAIAIGARDFLIAYNINLNSTSSRRANAIAFDIREAGRIKREGGVISGNVIKDENGEPVREPGSLKSVKGIGWYIKEYGIAQLSLNLTDINVTPTHIAFDEACEKARLRGIRVTGSELVGLVPLKVMIDAADYFLKKQQRSTGISESEKIKIAVKSLGLDDLAPFKPEERIIEYLIREKGQYPLIEKNLKEFAEETASESPAPGGGSISAYAGSLGAALSTMVANLSANKRGWDDRWEEFSNWADKGQTFQSKLLALVDADTAAFNGIMDAYGMPKTSDSQKAERSAAIQAATKHAIEIPMQVAEIAYEAMDVAQAMAQIGNPNSITDSGVGAMCLRSAVMGAVLNARVNAADLEDLKYVSKVLARCEELVSNSQKKEAEILSRVDEQLGA